jgi:hypothetical protein
MCWTLTASLIFIGIFIGSSILIWFINPKRRVLFIVLMLYFCGMEILQALQWYIGDVVDDFPSSVACSIVNRVFTYIAFAYVFFQPVLFSLIGGFAYSWNRIWISITLLNAIVFLINFGTLLISTQGNIDYPYASLTGGTFTNMTCTVIGPNHKLVWLFKVIDINYTVNFQTYMWLSLVPFLFYNRDLWSIPISWFVTLLISAFAFPTTSVELPSFWCLLSIISVVVIIVCVVIEKWYMKRKKNQIKLKK